MAPVSALQGAWPLPPPKDCAIASKVAEISRSFFAETRAHNTFAKQGVSKVSGRAKMWAAAASKTGFVQGATLLSTAESFEQACKNIASSNALKLDKFATAAATTWLRRSTMTKLRVDIDHAKLLSDLVSKAVEIERSNSWKACSFCKQIWL
eukprot:CAMPEP_0115581494 /NCGR_PEP_ID=MMETSP0272-20121206/5177_1 /TAXON_ID=71861 /ORGANISM="Scrippsiella trochoidea, Strain CCMP3099" /LENGTH=151 /DNA_ID=CAMNT_0003016459 /DNA_START=1354 /DNA_END=1809 /DNA_ORIENTATION=+